MLTRQLKSQIFLLHPCQTRKPFLTSAKGSRTSTHCRICLSALIGTLGGLCLFYLSQAVLQTVYEMARQLLISAQHLSRTALWPPGPESPRRPSLWGHVRRGPGGSRFQPATRRIGLIFGIVNRQTPGCKSLEHGLSFRPPAFRRRLDLPRGDTGQGVVKNVRCEPPTVYLARIRPP